MKRAAVLFAMITLSIAACAGDDSDVSVFAVDTDSSGAVDCADLDHVVECLNHPDSDACAHADVNGDGAVDDADVHDIHDGLEATGHHCDDGTHDDGAHDDGTHDDGTHSG